MEMHYIEPYIADPESEPEFGGDEQPLRPWRPRRPRRLMQGDTGTDRTYRVQNGRKLHAPYKTKSNHRHQPESIEVILESEPIEDDVSEPGTPAQNNDDYEDDVPEEEEEEEEQEEGGKCDASSDEDWVPQTEEGVEDIKKTSSEDDSDDLSDNETTTRGQKMKQLCTECGSFHYSKDHICEHKTKPYVCNVCGKRCVTEISLKLHSNIHSETYEHYCKYCYGTFKTKTHKLNHEQTHQSESKPYKCPDCGSTFASLKDRRKHMKLHKGPDEFKCDVCGLTIGKKHKPRHMMVHTGAKPYKCSICDRTFNQTGNLKSHMRLHTGERPYKCQYCNKAFNHNVSLKSHVQRYHPLDSSDLLDKIYEGLADLHDGTGEDSGDNVQKQDTEQAPKPKEPRYRTGRPRGRPKRNTTAKTEHPRSKSSEENANDSYDSNDERQGFADYYDDLMDFHQEEVEKAEKNMKRKCRSRGNSDSDYDPNEETGGKRGRPKKV